MQVVLKSLCLCRFIFCFLHKSKQTDNCVLGCLVLVNCNTLDKMQCQIHMVPSNSLLVY